MEKCTGIVNVRYVVTRGEEGFLEPSVAQVIWTLPSELISKDQSVQCEHSLGLDLNKPIIYQFFTGSDPIQC